MSVGTAGTETGASPAVTVFRVPKIHREGWPFVAVAAAVTLFSALLAPPLGWLGLLLTAAVALFFRDPDRITPIGVHLVVAPADGLITTVAPAVPPPELDLGATPRLRISTFLSVLDVHINRLPVGGTIAAVVYRPGRFLNAALDKASEDNERNAVLITMETGQQVAVVQIAGLIARRIRCWVGRGEPVLAGQRFGLIRFGSRVDVYLPHGATPLVVPGQRAVGGETVLADLHGGEPWRHGERR